MIGKRLIYAIPRSGLYTVYWYYPFHTSYYLSMTLHPAVFTDLLASIASRCYLSTVANIPIDKLVMSDRNSYQCSKSQ